MRRLAYIADVMVSLMLGGAGMLALLSVNRLLLSLLPSPHNYVLFFCLWFLVYLAIIAAKEKSWKAFFAMTSLKRVAYLIGWALMFYLITLILNQIGLRLVEDIWLLVPIVLILTDFSFRFFRFFRWGQVDDLPARIKAGDSRKVEQATALHPEEVNARTSSGHTPLTLALASDAPLELVRLLLEAGADPNMPDSRDIPPLFIAIFRSAVKKNDEPVELLLKYGAKPDAGIRGSGFLLHLTAGMKNAKVTQMLLDYQADPNSVNDRGFTPLHIAAITGNVAAVKLLLQHGADANARTATGFTPLQLAEQPGPYRGLWARKGRRRVAELLRQQASMG